MYLQQFLRYSILCLCFAVSSFSPVVKAQEIAIVPQNPSAEVLVGVSPVIFTGIVTGLHYGFHEKSTMPFTFVNFSGVEYLRKDSEVATEKGKTLKISLAGGIRDNLRIMEVDELPRFELGERYLVFLRGGGWRFSPIAGFDAGVFRLHGRLNEDAVILDYRGIPLAGVEKGRFIPATDVEAQNDFEQGVSEQALPPRLERKLRQRSNNVKEKSAQEKREAMLRNRELKQSERRSVTEDDNKMGRFAGYDKLLRLSHFKQFIDTYVKVNAGQYKSFSKLYLTPVNFSKKGFESVPPQTRQDQAVQ